MGVIINKVLSETLGLSRTAQGKHGNYEETNLKGGMCDMDDFSLSLSRTLYTSCSSPLSTILPALEKRKCLRVSKRLLKAGVRVVRKEGVNSLLNCVGNHASSFLFSSPFSQSEVAENSHEILLTNHFMLDRTDSVLTVEEVEK